MKTTGCRPVALARATSWASCSVIVVGASVSDMARIIRDDGMPRLRRMTAFYARSHGGNHRRRAAAAARLSQMRAHFLRDGPAVPLLHGPLQQRPVGHAGDADRRRR